jgi:hypothetical protein
MPLKELHGIFGCLQLHICFSGYPQDRCFALGVYRSAHLPFLITFDFLQFVDFIYKFTPDKE